MADAPVADEVEVTPEHDDLDLGAAVPNVLCDEKPDCEPLPGKGFLNLGVADNRQVLTFLNRRARGVTN